MASLFRTPLHSWHLEHGARMVPFHEWEMPLQYSSIVEEHNATRQACGLTDICHMGRLRLEGPAARSFLERLLSRRVTDLGVGQLRYALVTNEQGGIRDDVVVGCFPGTLAEPLLLVVVNAANRRKIVEWFRLQLSANNSAAPEVVLSDMTFLWAMFALQGPRAAEVLQPLVDTELRQLGRYRGAVTRFKTLGLGGWRAFLSRTGYTGEDGFEIIVPVEIGLEVWEAILEQGRPFGIKPTGLGARDTLRLEAALPLYGQELSEQVSPIEAGLEFACEVEGRDFVGAEALRQVKAAGPRRRLVCLESRGKRIPRTGCSILREGKVIGNVTSGTWSPTLQRPIAMGYVDGEYAVPGTVVHIEIRGNTEEAVVVERPFYRRRQTPVAPSV